MRIGVLEDATGVSRRLLRYYEEQGLLRPARLANGYRDYSEADVATVRRIRLLLAAGLPTAVINRILDCVHDDGGGRMTSSGCAGLTTHLRRERARIAEEIERLQASRQAVESMLALPTTTSRVLGQPPRGPVAHAPGCLDGIHSIGAGGGVAPSATGN